MFSKQPSFPALSLRLGLAALLLGGVSCFNTDQESGNGTLKGVFLEGMEWGRLVDILDENGILVEDDVLINHTLEGDGISYVLALNPVTEEETLRILHPEGSAAFEALLSAAQAGLEQIPMKGRLGPPPFGLIARNAAVRLQFSKQIDESTVDFTTVQVLTGDPPVQAFTGRYVVQNDAEADKGYVIFDPTVSALQAAEIAVPQNAVGFPASFDQLRTNIQVRVPTEPDPLFGQAKVLTALSGERPTVLDRDNEPFEETTSGKEVLVRYARTGNENDEYSGFMLDNSRPNLLAVLEATIADVAATGDERVDLTYSLDEFRCADLTPKVGDVFEVGDDTIMVVTDVVAPGNSAAYVVRAIATAGDLPAGSPATGARLTTRYAAADQPLQTCFLQFEPPPTDFPSGRIDPNSTVTVRFDEPIDGRTVLSMRSFVALSVEDNNNPNGQKEEETAWFRQVDQNETVGEYIDRQRGYDLRVNILGTDQQNSEWFGRVQFGPIESSDGDRAFTLAPLAGWAELNDHNFLRFTVALRDGADGIRDLAGNPVSFTAFVAGNEDQAGFISVRDINGGQNGGANAAIQAGYFSLLGRGLDEDGDGLAEWAGQAGVGSGVVRGRTPARFSRSADQTNATIGARLAGTPVNEPLNPAGAVTQHAYRPQDFGFGYGLVAEYNMGIDGMAWSPNAGVVFDENFNEISLSMSHAAWLPDESINLQGQPNWPLSGLVATGFDDNILGFIPSGGLIDEKEMFRSSYAPRSVEMYNVDGTPFLAWPTFQSTYVWRDTTLPQDFLGGANSIGSPNQQWLIDNNALFLFWNPGEVPSVGLPLLCRFRTYPQANALGLNTFSTTQMMTTSALPAFRVYSAGGQNGSGTWIQVRPDNPAAGGTVPSGGFLPGGNATPTQFDSLVLWAQADFTIQVSRLYTHWFDMGKLLAPGDTLGLLVEPDNADQPQTTSVEVEFRGAVQVDHQGDPLVNPSPILTAGSPFDDYGDHLGTGWGTVSTPSAWTQVFTDLEDNNYRFFQVRVTFIGNAKLGVEPTLDGLGVAWKR